MTKKRIITTTVIEEIDEEEDDDEDDEEDDYCCSGTICMGVTLFSIFASAILLIIGIVIPKVWLAIANIIT